MVEHPQGDSAYDELESMIRAAGGYLQASDDLRPRLLESARLMREERRVRRCVRRLTLVVFVLMALTTSANERSEFVGSGRALAAASAWRPIVDGHGAGPDRSGTPTWGLVEAFTELRQQQSEALTPGR